MVAQRPENAKTCSTMCVVNGGGETARSSDPVADAEMCRVGNWPLAAHGYIDDTQIQPL